MNKKIIAAFLIICTAFSFFAIAENGGNENSGATVISSGKSSSVNFVRADETGTAVSPALGGEDELIAQNDALELYLNTKNLGVKLRNKKSG